MSAESPLFKRIKRHVIGRQRTYFVAVAPGFEDLCYRELSDLGLPAENTSVVEGGVEFKGRLLDCYQANLHLRTASRILLRIDEFKATGFRQLEKKIAGIPWELYLPPAVLPNIHVTTRHCRLYHTAAVGQRFIDGISRRAWNNDVATADKKEAASELTIFVRGVDDRFSVSIDSSGNPLFKRGLKSHSGKAPIRETYAAAALMLAGYTGAGPLIDPMCGTGTFSLEAALIVKNIPPGWFRDFAFMHWPSYNPKQWQYLKHQREAFFENPRSLTVFASDQDSSACVQLESCIEKNQLSDVIAVAQKNFFDLMPAELTDQSGLVVINPPYGIRLGNLEKSEALFMAICDRLSRSYRHWRVVLVAPDRKLIKKLPFRLEILPLFHGGLNPVLMFGTIS